VAGGITGVKVSVSLPEDDIAFLDDYAANRARERTAGGVVTVVPITSSTSRVLPFQTLLPAAECGLPTDSKAQAEQVRTVAIQRLQGRIGAIPAARLRQLDDALRLHLAL
jgi:mRNA interferase MazF